VTIPRARCGRSVAAGLRRVDPGCRLGMVERVVAAGVVMGEIAALARGHTPSEIPKVLLGGAHRSGLQPPIQSQPPMADTPMANGAQLRC
jgi:hypothetical protein